ncbi:MAG: hypothetical protein PWQ29_605 [Verrucomicrobiota bacterium]|nr:hypothetical protein [Verrucomicrobiota bacterium]
MRCAKRQGCIRLSSWMARRESLRRKRSAVIWLSGGLVFLARTPGYAEPIYSRMQTVCSDEEFARLQGHPGRVRVCFAAYLAHDRLALFPGVAAGHDGFQCALRDLRFERPGFKLSARPSFGTGHGSVRRCRLPAVVRSAPPVSGWLRRGCFPPQTDAIHLHRVILTE